MAPTAPTETSAPPGPGRDRGAGRAVLRQERRLPGRSASVRVLAAWGALTALTGLVNLLVYAAARAVGAQMTLDHGSLVETVSAVSVVVSTGVALAIVTVLWWTAGRRIPVLVALWGPLGWAVGLVSLGRLLGVTDASSALALGGMHLLVTAAATLALPRLLPEVVESAHANRGWH